jgi:hypothetical protein
MIDTRILLTIYNRNSQPTETITAVTDNGYLN